MLIDLLKLGLWLFFFSFLAKIGYYQYSMAFPERWDEVYIKDLTCDSLPVPNCEMKQGMAILKDVYVGEDFDDVILSSFEKEPNGKKSKAYEIITSKDRIISKSKIIKANANP